MLKQQHINAKKNISLKALKVALVGNPNSGKSSLFNVLTGLNQQVGNFPGVTVEKKTGMSNFGSTKAEIIDLPGCYSVAPKSIDEEISFNVLCNPSNLDKPDVVVVVADASNLKRSLFLCTQIIDLKVPAILVLNMIDQADKKGVTIDIEALSVELGIPVVYANARKQTNIKALTEVLSQPVGVSEKTIVDVGLLSAIDFTEAKLICSVNNTYSAFAISNSPAVFLDADKVLLLELSFQKHNYNRQQVQSSEALHRYAAIGEIIKKCTSISPVSESKVHATLDKILAHRVLGYLIFLIVLFFIFQAIFTWSAYPMDLIEKGLMGASVWLTDVLPTGILANLLCRGIIPGLTGVLIFVPQIALLFAFIAILEDTGYMARVSFIMDKLMRKFGLNGRSVIPLIGGVACAVPAIMSARTISNWKERMVTIMVTPLMSCSARLPVFTLLIALIIPSDKTMWGFSSQGITLMMLYLIGLVSALLSAYLMQFFIKTKEKSYFIMEMPNYRSPRWDSIGIIMIEKVKTFVLSAGKIIVVISIMLWALSSFGPEDTFGRVEQKYSTREFRQQLSEKEILNKIAAEKLETSYTGMLGKKIAPVISPLGFDWKIGVSLITSFAAREVFVGTMATLYSVGDSENTHTVREKMAASINPITGGKTYTFAVGFSLLLFYVFALQCMSTIAVVYKETKHWKWPLIQFLYMGALAYLSSFIAYTILK